MAGGPASKVINGRYGTLWFDNQELAEVYAFRAVSKVNKETITRTGTLINGSKVTSIDNTGTLTMHKVDSFLLEKLGDELNAGKWPTFTLVSKLADPESNGEEKITLYNVSFDDLTLADWDAGATGKIEAAFTFESFKIEDKIAKQ